MEQLSSVTVDAAGNVATDAEGRELLWGGLSSDLSAAICSALDAAHIAHVETAKEFGLLRTAAQSAKFIWIDGKDYAAARALLDKILSGDEYRDQVNDEAAAQGFMNPLKLNLRKSWNAREDQSENGNEELPSDDDGSDESDPQTGELAEDPHPEDATVEVWSGEDAAMADYLALCLRGVGVGCVVGEDDGKSRVMVLPESGQRAKEIVHEVVDEEPPK